MKEKIKKYAQNRWLMIGVGVIILAIAGLLLPFVSNAEGRVNYAVALPVVLCLFGGLWVIYYAIFKIQTYSTGGIFSLSPTLRPREYKGRKKPNTINILAKRNDSGQVAPVGIQFIYSSKHTGQLRRLENTNEYFYLRMNSLTKNKMVDMVLPDTMYLDPREYKTPLTMPATAAYWRPKPKLWQKLAPFALVAVILLEWIASITID